MRTKIKSQGGQALAGRKIDADGYQKNTTSPCQSQDDISLFQGVINQRPFATTTWQKVLEDIRSDKYKKDIETARTVLHKFGSDSDEYREIKKKLPSVTFGGVFSPHRAKINIASPTGIIIPDLDHLDERTEIIFRLLTQDENVWFAFRSPSGEGLKVGIRTQGIKNDDNHKKLYFAVERYFKDIYGIEIDSACKDISRLTFVSHDPGLWINPDPQYFDISAWSKPLPPAPQAVKPSAFTNTTGKQKYARKALESRCREIRESLPRTQHNTRLRASRLMGGFLQYIEETEVVAALEGAVIASGAKDIRASMKTVRDGLEFGKLSPIIIEDLHGSNAPPYSESNSPGQDEPQDDSLPTEESLFDTAKEQYPRTSFPWDVLPESIAGSLQQLARSCATSSTSLPGAAFCILASAVGSKVSISPKTNWNEPLILWCGDIRPSGEGKTPPPRALMHVLYEAQQMANAAYELELEAWNLLSKKDRGKPPDRPRGFFVTDLTLEGLRTDHSGHGGKVCVLDELSSFLTSQNQYKKKGSDRESWLCLHDGNPARIVRAKETLTLTGCRISVFGGIQPGVWQKIFSEDDGLHLVDGTIYRFLPTYEGNSYHPLTKESWSDDNRKAWESLLRDALSWSDNQEKPTKLKLSDDAQEIFLEWRNDLFQTKDDLPPQIQGFIPKLTGYALRVAGVLYLMHRFSSQGQEIGGTIHRDFIERGIRVSEFYLGHIICAMEALAGDVSSPLEHTEQVTHLAKTLEGLKLDLDSGRLAVGYIHEKFNATCKPEQKLNTARAMGASLRKCGLTIPGGLFDSNGKQRAKCLQWDKKTNSFIETCLERLERLETEKCQGLQERDIEKPTSRTSRNMDKSETSETLKNQRLASETVDIIGERDVRDIRDEFSKEKENNGFEDLGAGCSDYPDEM